MKKHLAVSILALIALPLIAQGPPATQPGATPPGMAAGGAPPTPPAPTTQVIPPTTQEVEPKESPDWLKLQLAIEKAKNLNLDWQHTVETAYSQQMKPKLDALDAEAKGYLEAIKKANAWGDDVQFDWKSGKFVKTIPAAAAPAATPKPEEKKK